MAMTIFIALTGMSGIVHAEGAAASKQGAYVFRHGLPGLPACISCHGVRARGGMGPRLAGLGQDYIVRQLRTFATGHRPGSVMHSIAGKMNARTMQQLAVWIATLQPHIRARIRSTQADASARRLMVMGDWSRGIPACIDCHGATLMGGGSNIPALAGQQETYIAMRLQWFRLGSRAGEKPHSFPSLMMKRIASGLSRKEVKGLAHAIALLDGTPVHWSPDAHSVWPHTLTHSRAAFTPPPESELPQSPQLAAATRQGKRIFMDTTAYAKEYVGHGNRLACVHCHLDRGRLATAAPMWAAAVRYPMYRSKNHRVNTLAMRIQGCFRYSLNGGAPPPATSPVMVDLMAYIRWLATGLPTGVQPPLHGFPSIRTSTHAPDKMRGEKLYVLRCAMCHGMDGQGKMDAGRTLFPPLWGSHSFTFGAGMHRVGKDAAFIKANMPYGAEGSLNTQDAWDIAAFVDSHSRPQDPRTKGVHHT